LKKSLRRKIVSWMRSFMLIIWIPKPRKTKRPI